ncbi:erp6p [Saccharomyces arboricola H-6]|uniref:Erp6p n=1 Tax=Saccharomyces arboricola (strain H-6 / AS 2.3317 / CBS 10644) TaxID=1160507 RepID=J8LNN9_SACAR|nr:erp6p [Saccharomyces arboricola H-6]
MLLYCTLLVFVFFPFRASAFYFYGYGGDRKCFLKELSKGTLLKGSYSLGVYDEKLGDYALPGDKDYGVVIDVEEVFDNNHRVVHQRSSPSGDFTFLALESGEYKICAQSQVNNWVGKAKTKLEVGFEIGSEAMLDSKRKETLETLHGKVNILNSKIMEIRREQQLVREREESFRDISESVNSRAMWWTVIQVVLLILICVWQMKSLRSFFVKQKVL